jgi:hypothetical protein
MKKIYKYFALFLIAFCPFFISNCADGFEELNTNPRTLGTVSPEMLLYRTQMEYILSGHAWENIFYTKTQWVQHNTAAMWFAGEGNMLLRWTYERSGLGNTLYSEYNNMGSYVVTIETIVRNHEESARYSNLIQMNRILLIAKAIQTSDMWGSLVYSDGWKAREGLDDFESMNPRFQTQEELVAVWDRELKECIANLQAKLNDPTQIALRGNDRAYAGNPAQWIKAGNAIRLRLASRLWNIQPATARAIAAEVLAPANAANLMSHINDSFIFWYDNLFTNVTGGDWHSFEDLNRAGATLMDYMNENEDPRRRAYYVPNNLTPANIAGMNASLKTASPRPNPLNMMPSYMTRFEGATQGFDRRRAVPVLEGVPLRNQFPDGDAGTTAYNTAWDKWFEDTNFDPDVAWSTITSYDRRYLNVTWNNMEMRPANRPQTRLWRGNWQAGSGGNWIPVMTYADFCFLAAEFVLREGIASSKTAQDWYETGLRASLDQWNQVGTYCALEQWTPFTEAEITTFLNKPNIKWNATKGLEQIYAQTWVEHYKNADEAWAFYKRTNYPNTETTIVTYETPMVNGIARIVPRRAKFTMPAEGVHNYENRKLRIEEMMRDPKFGAMDNEWGRLWWDAPASN